MDSLLKTNGYTLRKPRDRKEHICQLALLNSNLADCIYLVKNDKEDENFDPYDTDCACLNDAVRKFMVKKQQYTGVVVPETYSVHDMYNCFSPPLAINPVNYAMSILLKYSHMFSELHEIMELILYTNRSIILHYKLSNYMSIFDTINTSPIILPPITEIFVYINSIISNDRNMYYMSLYSDGVIATHAYKQLHTDQTNSTTTQIMTDFSS